MDGLLLDCYPALLSRDEVGRAVADHIEGPTTAENVGAQDDGERAVDRPLLRSRPTPGMKRPTRAA